VNILADAVKVTLGPKGRYVVLDQEVRRPHHHQRRRHDRRDRGRGRIENQGAQLVRGRQRPTTWRATPPATVLAQRSSARVSRRRCRREPDGACRGIERPSTQSSTTGQSKGDGRRTSPGSPASRRAS
jgi:hypothetical protein